MQTAKEEIQKYKERLYLASLKVSTQVMEDAYNDEEYLRSGLLYSAASLLKLSVDEIVVEKDGTDLGAGLRDLIRATKEDK